jgi:hypothetical protein
VEHQSDLGAIKLNSVALLDLSSHTRVVSDVESGEQRG